MSSLAFPTSCPCCHPAEEALPVRTATEFKQKQGEGSVWETHTRVPPASTAHGEQPSLAGPGKSRKIDFCFSTMCRVFIEQAAAGVSIRVTWRELDQEHLPVQPAAFLGWVKRPVVGMTLRAWVGTAAAVGPLGTGCALAQQGQDQCKSILIDDAACDGGD